MARRESGRRRRSEDISDIVPSDGGRTPLADSDVDHELSAGGRCAERRVRAPTGSPAGRGRPPGGRARTACGGGAQPRGGWCAVALLPLCAEPVGAARLWPGHGLQPLGRPPSPGAAALVRRGLRRRGGAPCPRGRRRAWPLAAGRHGRSRHAAAVRDHRPRLRSGAGGARPGTGARDPLQPRHDRRQRGHAPRALEAGAERRHPRRARRAASSSRPGPTATPRPAGCCSSAAWWT